MVKLNFETLLDWVEGRLPKDQAQQIAEALERADESTLADLDWIREFQGLSESVTLGQTPSHVKETLRKRFDEFARERKGPSFFERLTAALTFDSHTQFAAAGVRSATIEGVQRQLVYSSEAIEIIFNIQPQDNGEAVNLTGQVFPSDERDTKSTSIQLLKGDQEVRIAMADELGEFTIREIPPDHYRIVVGSELFQHIGDLFFVFFTLCRKGVGGKCPRDVMPGEFLLDLDVYDVGGLMALQSGFEVRRGDVAVFRAGQDGAAQ